MTDFRAFVRELVVDVFGLPESHLEAHINHNLSFVLTYAQALAVSSAKFKKALPPLDLEKDTKDLFRSDSGGDLMSPLHECVSSGGRPEAGDLELAPGAYGGLVFVPKGSYGALALPAEVVEMAFAAAHAQNAVESAETIPMTRDSGKKISGKTSITEGETTLRSAADARLYGGARYVEHFYDETKLWWAKPDRFERFTMEVLFILDLDLPSEENLKAALLHYRARTRGRPLRSALHDARIMLDDLTAQMNEAFERAGVNKLAGRAVEEMAKSLPADMHDFRPRLEETRRPSGPPHPRSRRR